MEIKGVNALVTGASSGIGRAIAIELVENGAAFGELLESQGTLNGPQAFSL